MSKTRPPSIDLGRYRRGSSRTPRQMNRRVPKSAVETVGVIAQLGERFNGIEEVVGSIPSGSTTLRPDGATRGTATGSTFVLGEAVPGVARRAKTGWHVSSNKLFLSAPMGLRVAQPQPAPSAKPARRGLPRAVSPRSRGADRLGSRHRTPPLHRRRRELNQPVPLIKTCVKSVIWA